MSGKVVSEGMKLCSVSRWCGRRLGIKAVAECVLTMMSAGLGPCATTPHAATDKRETTTDTMLSQT